MTDPARPTQDADDERETLALARMVYATAHGCDEGDIDGNEPEVAQIAGLLAGYHRDDGLRDCMADLAVAQEDAQAARRILDDHRAAVAEYERRDDGLRADADDIDHRFCGIDRAAAFRYRDLYRGLRARVEALLSYVDPLRLPEDVRVEYYALNPAAEAERAALVPEVTP